MIRTVHSFLVAAMPRQDFCGYSILLILLSCQKLSVHPRFQFLMPNP